MDDFGCIFLFNFFNSLCRLFSLQISRFGGFSHRCSFFSGFLIYNFLGLILGGGFFFRHFFLGGIFRRLFRGRDIIRFGRSFRCGFSLHLFPASANNGRLYARFLDSSFFFAENISPYSDNVFIIQRTHMTLDRDIQITQLAEQYFVCQIKVFGEFVNSSICH